MTNVAFWNYAPNCSLPASKTLAPSKTVVSNCSSQACFHPYSCSLLFFSRSSFFFRFFLVPLASSYCFLVFALAPCFLLPCLACSCSLFFFFRLVLAACFLFQYLACSCNFFFRLLLSLVFPCILLANRQEKTPMLLAIASLTRPPVPSARVGGLQEHDERQTHDKNWQKDRKWQRNVKNYNKLPK